MSLERWKRAHQAEKQHSTHQSGPPNRNQVNEILKNHGTNISELNNKAVLAVGGGTGIIHRLPNTSLAITADPITDLVSEVLVESSAELCTAAGENLPFISNSFDFVICRNVLDHVVDPNTVLDEIKRVIKPDGKMIFDINTFDIPAPVRRRLSLIDAPHPYHFSTDEVKKLLENSGFKIEYADKWRPSIRKSNLKRSIAILAFRMKKINMLCSL
ncbi:class I SAM-dependent methyltransferase [Halobellus clavatus]|uniref:Ubiquinone/menaquinone biosynthesis C-methylase UbiE n=1 Tax=Halobellus clavatus TaxID=660517 RepID=A0A1H3KYS2_9EURY|nr:class I SAM-dependent methyltransferase [Halobellus clavatus]SDY57240.1 Ubiquinone/menaquinone biosynthesis C-methylase UbiE [Halobellus clavatus]